MDEIEPSIRLLLMNLHKKYGWFNGEELSNTPRRMARFFEEWRNCQEDFNFTTFEGETDDLVILKNISFYSLCAHHLLPFYGKAHIAYLPKKKVCGVSKLARSVIQMSSKPSQQENLTHEICGMVYKKTGGSFAMVIVEAQHLCMMMRGIRQHSSLMVTSAIKKDRALNWEGLKEETLKLVLR